MGRPKIEINEDEVEKLAGFGCSIREIASFFDCSEDTIAARFSANIKKGKDSGKTRLRKLQWKACEDGNATMLIWLGKQYLEQTDKQDVHLVQEQKALTPEMIREIVAEIEELKR